MNSTKPARIVVGVDGSEQATFALAWAARMANGMGSEVVAVYAVDLPSWYGSISGVVPPQYDPEWRAETKAEVEGEWCKPLKDAGVRYRTRMEDGRAATVINSVADEEHADLILVGRRGRGGVAELVLGSVSHELVLHSRRPVLVISSPPKQDFKGIRTIVVGLDGSAQSGLAMDWAIGAARAMHSQIVAVHAMPLLAYEVDFYGMAPPVQYDPEWAQEIKRQFEDEWVKPLRDSGIPFQTVLKDGRPASLVLDTADQTDADLIVMGRRGLGGVSELFLGSVSHELTLRSKRPVLLVSEGLAAEKAPAKASAAKSA